MSAADLSAAIVYRVEPASPHARQFAVTCRIENPDPAGQRVAVPAWIPGSYLVRDYARHVIRITAEARGGEAAIRKLDKHTWQVAPAEGPLLIRTVVYAADPSVRGAVLDPEGGFFNGVCLFLRVEGREDDPCVVHLDPPPAVPGAPPWRVATTLPRLTGTRHDFGAFRAPGYADLVDHPVVMGTFRHEDFTVAGVPHALVVSGAPRADLGRASRDLARICQWQASLFGLPLPVDRYLFLTRALPDAYGGLEHRYSTALVCRPDDLPSAATPAHDDGYRRFLGLASHEYFHLWLVRRIRPAAFAAADPGREAYTRLLWLFEGVTSYYDDLALLRAGVVSPESYLELLGRTLTQLYRTPGRREQTLEDSSFDAWIKFYRPDENSPNATVSYYVKGALVALALDLEIRLKSDSRRCLDDVLRALWREYGGDASPGLPEDAFEDLAAEVAGIDLEPFFRQNLRSTVDPPLGILLAQFGVRLQLRAAESVSDSGGTRGRREDRPRPWLGLRVRQDGVRLRVAYVQDGGPAQLAGIVAGDELVALDDRRVTADTYEARLERLPVDMAIACQLFRDDRSLVVALRPQPAPRDTCYLTLDADASAAACARRAAWLASESPAP